MDKQNRLLTFTFRLTKAERRALDKLARLHGDKTAAEYVRRVALPNGSRQVPHGAPSVNGSEDSYEADVTRAGLASDERMNSRG